MLPENVIVKPASILCFIVTLLAMYYKIRLHPASVFLLAVASVILNTYAVGYGLSFKYAVICSPILTMAQAFLTLPFRLITE